LPACTYQVKIAIFEGDYILSVKTEILGVAIITLVKMCHNPKDHNEQE
jgi:hypothetical protein